MRIYLVLYSRSVCRSVQRMSQKGLIYSFVAKGTVVLAEHTPYSGNFSTIAVQCLQKLPTNSSKYTYSCDGHTFNFLVDNGFGEFFSRCLLVSWSFLSFLLLTWWWWCIWLCVYFSVSCGCWWVHRKKCSLCVSWAC